MPQNVRIDRSAHETLQKVAKTEGISMQTALKRAIELYRRHVFFEGLAREYEALKANPDAWAEEKSEQALWETTLGDGLDR